MMPIYNAVNENYVSYSYAKEILNKLPEQGKRIENSDLRNLILSLPNCSEEFF
jgi:DNA-directed RNA polymerase subunit F